MIRTWCIHQGVGLVVGSVEKVIELLVRGLVRDEVELGLHDVCGVEIVELVGLEVGQVGEALQEDDAVVD